MNKYIILCIDDEREVLDSVTEDLEPLKGFFDIEAAESAREARDIVDDVIADERMVALVLCDHIMPGTHGVDFLISLNQNEKTTNTIKILLTGLADQEDTIKAVNEANLDHYIAKPWDGQELYATVVDHLTSYIIDNEEDMVPYAKILDGPRIFQAIHDKGLMTL